MNNILIKNSLCLNDKFDGLSMDSLAGGGFVKISDAFLTSSSKFFKAKQQQTVVTKLHTERQLGFRVIVNTADINRREFARIRVALSRVRR